MLVAVVDEHFDRGDCATKILTIDAESQERRPERSFGIDCWRPEKVGHLATHRMRKGLKVSFTPLALSRLDT
ncbi:hypothetical protein ACVILI_003105 [Mesorhizobium sp. USDA 4775]